MPVRERFVGGFINRRSRQDQDKITYLMEVSLYRRCTCDNICSKDKLKSPAKQDYIILRLYFVFLIQLTFELKCVVAYA